MDKEIGLRLTADASQVSDAAKQLAIFEKRLEEVKAALKQNKDEAGDTTKYAKLREEQIKLQKAATDTRKEIRDQERDFKQAKFPADSIIGLRKRYRELFHEIEGLSKADPEFKRKSKEAKELSDEINKLSKNAGSYKDNIGRYAESIGGLFGNFGSLAGGLAAGGGIVAGLEILKEGVVIVSELTQEMVKLRGEISNLTGAQGEELDRFAAKLSSVAKTFGKDTNELLISANALAKAYDIDLGQALDQISKGFLAGADAQGEYLKKIEEYPIHLKNAGFSVEEFIKLATQEVRAGIYDDKLIDTIKETDLSLKEFTKTQRDALLALGPEFANALEKDIRSGEISVKEALVRIVEESKKQGLNLQQFQTITADIFKGAGEDAGGFAKVAEVVFNAMQGSVDDLINTENQLVQQQLELLRVNQEFADAQVDLANELGAVDGSLKTVGIQIKTGLLQGLVFIIQRSKEMLDIMRPVGDAVLNLARALGIVDDKGQGAKGMMDALARASDLAAIPVKALYDTLAFLINGLAGAVEKGKDFLTFLGIINKEQEDLAKQQQDAAQQQQDTQQQSAKTTKTTTQEIVTETEKARKSLVAMTAEQTKLREQILDAKLNNKPYAGLLREYNRLTAEIDKVNSIFNKNGQVAEKLAGTSLLYLQQRVQKLRTDLSKAPDEGAYLKIEQELEKVQMQLDVTTAAYQRASDARKALTAVPEAIVSGAEKAGVDDPLQGINQVLETLGIEKEARLEIERETAEEIQALRDRNEEEFLAKHQAALEADYALQLEFEDARKSLMQSTYNELGEALFSFLGDQNVTFKDYLKNLIITLLSSVEKTILLTTVEAQAKVITANAGLPLIGVAKGLAESALLAGIIKGLFAGVKSAVQNFHTGGQVLSLEQLFGVQHIPTIQRSGTIRQVRNISGQPGGDNVLARVKVGELILNDQQQLRLKALAGRDIFKRIGVPGLATGGFVAPNLVNPNSYLGATAGPLPPVSIDGAAITMQAQAIAAEVSEAVSAAMEQAVYDANERARRRANLDKTIEL